MNLRTLSSGIIAASLFSATPLLAGVAGSATADSADGWTIPLPGWSRTHQDEPTVRMAQASDPRVTSLEEQVRALNGTIEELNFQILQMQEQLRKIQEDNEFRFQEIEKKRSDAGSATGEPAAETRVAAPAAKVPQVSPVEEIASSSRSEETASSLPPVENGAAQLGGTQELGTITFDASGNVSGGNVGDEAKVGGGSGANAGLSILRPDGTEVAALPSSDDPEELYRDSYQFILSGDYATAETGFRDHIARFPADARAADANFWLGEALLQQNKHRDAAEIFLAANKQYPSAKKAPDMLLKLGVALSGLKQRDVACATFGEVEKRYPQASSALKDRVKQEQALAAC